MFSNSGISNSYLMVCKFYFFKKNQVSSANCVNMRLTTCVWVFDTLIGITFLKRTEEFSISYVNVYFTNYVKNLTFDSVLIQLLKELVFQKKFLSIFRSSLKSWFFKVIFKSRMIKKIQQLVLKRIFSSPCVTVLYSRCLVKVKF